MSSLNPFFQIFTKNRPFIDPDSSKWPKEWKEIRFKSYPRFKKIILPQPNLDEKFPLKKAILERRSKRDFLDNALLDLQALSNLLFYSAGITEEGKFLRAYPSGGARYPLEMYVFLFKGRDIETGLFHYNVLKHNLEKILDKEVLKLKKSFQGTFIEKAEAVIVISSIEQRSFVKYGNLAYKLMLLEAGHLGQNVYLISEAIGLKCCALGDFNKNLVHTLLDIDGITETAFYALAIGH